MKLVSRLRGVDSNKDGQQQQSPSPPPPPSTLPGGRRLSVAAAPPRAASAAGVTAARDRSRSLCVERLGLATLLHPAAIPVRELNRRRASSALSSSNDLISRRGVFSRRHYGSVELLPQLDASGQDPGGRRFRIENGDSLGEKEEIFGSPCTPVLENPEFQTRWYFKYFLGKLHQNYVGSDMDKFPFFLSVVLTDANHQCVPQYRAILWRKTEDIVPFKVIFNAMVEREELMIVRKIYLNNCLPTIGAMFPQREDSENYFVCVNLPFAEDEHLFKLPSLKSFKPNYEENNAVRNLIDAMDLDKDGNELFMPENTHDPELQYVYDCIAQKAINPNKLLTKTIPEHIQSLLNPPKRIMEKSKQTINEIIKIFSLQQEKYEKCLVEDNNILQSDSDEETDLSKQCVITAFSPIEDFNKLLKNGFNSVIVCENMKHITLDLIESSTSMEDLEKPALNLKVLREFYINNNDIKSYNNLMYLVKDSVLISGKEGMWSQFVDSGIGLITNQEIEISDISQELSEQFIKHEVLQDVAAEFIIDDDDPVPLSAYNKVLERAIIAESKVESSNAFKWFVTARSAIEEFEDTHLRKIRIEVPKDNINDIFEKRRLRRQIKWQQILEKCEEYDVQKLLQRLENNKMLKDDFCIRISVAYGMLSKIIHNAMLTPGSGQISFSFLTSDEDVNKAIQIFMQGFEIKDQIIETIK